MNMKRVEEIKNIYEAIQNERINGKGMRYDKHSRSDEMAISFENAGYIDELFSTIKQQQERIEKYEKALKKIEDKTVLPGYGMQGIARQTSEETE